MQIFRALGAPPPDPRTSGGWGLRPQPPLVFGGWRLRPQTQKLAPSLRISGYAPGSIFGEDLFFWSLPEFGEKSVPFLVKTFFLLFT